MAKLEAGDRAPEFTLKDQDEREVSLSDYAGEKLLLYFYPKAMTSGCTVQACGVRDALPDFDGLGVAAVGVSPDSPRTQKRFDEKYSLGFPLLSDSDHAVAEKYGVWGRRRGGAEPREGIIRSSFLIDEEGRIIRAWYDISPEETVPEAKKALLES